MKYKVVYERKDYGDGSACYCVTVDASSSEEAENLVRKTRCGVEMILSVDEI